MSHDVGTCVVLPGRAYTAQMPLLDLTTRAVQQHGWEVRSVSWEYERMSPDDTAAWAGRHLADAVAGIEGHVLVVAKSLGCYAAATAAEHGYDALWLTPVLTDPLVADALAHPEGRQLVVGGTADHLWDTAVARLLPGEVVEIAGADHSLGVDGDVVRTAQAWLDLARRVDGWLGGTRGR